MLRLDFYQSVLMSAASFFLLGNKDLINEFSSFDGNFDENQFIEINDKSENQIIGEYVLIQPIKYTFYNFENRSFDSQIIKKAESVKFFIIDNLLIVIGKKNICNKLINLLNKNYQNCSFEQMSFNFEKSLASLQDFNFNAKKLILKDMLLMEDIVGTYTTDLSNNNDSYSIIKDFQNKISKISFTIDIFGCSLNITLSDTGTVLITGLDLQDITVISTLVTALNINNHG